MADTAQARGFPPREIPGDNPANIVTPTPPCDGATPVSRRTERRWTRR